MSIHSIPGVKVQPGREFWYVEWKSASAFRDVFPTISTAAADGPPTHGGILNEDVVIETPAGAQLHGVSFKGDMAGWQRNLKAFATNHSVLVGRIFRDRLELSDSSLIDLDACVVLQGR